MGLIIVHEIILTQLNQRTIRLLAAGADELGTLFISWAIRELFTSAGRSALPGRRRERLVYRFLA